VTRGIAFSLLLLGASPAAADDLYRPDGWSGLATDRRAAHVGDLLTILVYEASSASNVARSGSKKSSNLSGRISAGSSLNESAGLGVAGNSDSQGSSGRSGQMVAQISAAVEEVLANGDLRVVGSQVLNLSGEKTVIRVRGRVRAADVSATNAVLSNRLADAEIDYDGKGYVSRSGKPGVLTRVFNWLGLM